jgi:hypothetical protein
VGSKTDNPCPNIATVEDECGVMICEAHRRVFELGKALDGYVLAEEFLGEAIEKLEELSIYGASGIPLLRRARDEARAEHQRIRQAMDILSPCRTT